MNIELANLPVGKWRYFTLPEIEKLNQMVAESSKTDGGSAKNEGGERAKVQYIPKRKKPAETGDKVSGEKGHKAGGDKAKKPAPVKASRPKPERTSKVIGEKGKGSRGSKFKDFRGKKK